MVQKMLDNKAKRELKTNQRRVLIDSIEIGIPSPQHILSWGERRLPNGEKVGQIKNSKTVSYKRLTPLRDGLFCERIFGPVNSFVCSCGKAQPRADITFCEKCQVEYTDQRARRYRLGYISLLSPVAHIWYLKGRPSYLSLFLGQRKKKIVALAYCNAYLIEQGFSESFYPNLTLAPAGVRPYNQKREAHGMNSYTQNLNSLTSVRQMRHLSDVLRSTRSHTDTPTDLSELEHGSTASHAVTQKVPPNTDASFETQTENPNQSSTNRTEKRADAPQRQISRKSSHKLSRMQGMRSDWQNSRVGFFQEQINRATSPPSFSHLLAEVLGHVEKNIVLIDSSKGNSAPMRKQIARTFNLSQTLPLVEKRETNRTETLLSLQPLWGYTYLEQDAPASQSLRALLSRAKRVLSSTHPQSRTERGDMLSTGPEPGLVYDSSSNPETFALPENGPQGEGVTQKTHAYLQTGTDSVPSLSQHFECAEESYNLSGTLSFQKASIDLTPRVRIFAASSLPLRGRANLLRTCFHDQKSTLRTQPVRISPNLSLLDPSQGGKLLRKDVLPFPQGYTKEASGESGLKNQKGQRFLATYPSSAAQAQHQTDVSSPTLPLGLESRIQSVRAVGRGLKKLEVVPCLSYRLRIAFKDARAVAFDEQAALLGQNSVSLPMTVQDDVLQALRVRDRRSNTVQFSGKKPVDKVVHRLEKEMKSEHESEHFPDREHDLSFLPPKTAFRAIAQTPQKGVRAYNRAHTFPFLPHLVCQYNLRDQLLNFLNSSPLSEDIPIPMYCELPRRSPLRDVNQLVPEDTFSQFESKPFNNPNVSESRNFESSKEKRNRFFQAAVGKGAQDNQLYRARSLPDPQVNATVRKNFLNVKAESVGQSSSNALFKGWNSFSKNRKENVLSTERNSQRGAEHTTREQLASLRSVLYTALLQKSTNLRVTRLDARIRKMSALLTTLSRENLIHESIKVSLLNKSFFHPLTQKSGDSRSAGVLGSQPSQANSHRPVSSLDSSWGTETQAKKKRRLSINGSGNSANFSGLPLQQLVSNREEILRKIKHLETQVQTGSKNFKEVSSLLRITNHFKFESPERSYRSLILEKRWLGSFLLEKHWVDKESGALIDFNPNKVKTVLASPKSAVSQQGELASEKQARLAPSIVHALRQHASAKTKVNPYPFQTENAQLSSLQSSVSKVHPLHHRLALRDVGVSNRALKAAVLSHEKRLINRVYNSNFVYTHGERVQNTPSASEPLLLSQPFRTEEVFLREAALLSALSPELRPKGVQNFLQSCTQAQSDSSLFERSPTSSSGQTVRNAAEGSSALGKGFVTHLSGRAVPEDATPFSSSLSFFLIPPNPERKEEKESVLLLARFEHTSSHTLREASSEEQGGEGAQMPGNQTSVQLQAVNGTSRLIETTHTLFDGLSHQIHTGERYQEAVQASPPATSNLSNDLPDKMGLPDAERLLLEQGSTLPGDPRLQRSFLPFSHRKALHFENRVHQMEKGRKGFMQQEDQRSALADSTTFEEQTDQLSPFEYLTIREILSYTGGGALHKLLQRYDTQLFATLLFADLENARDLYRKRIAERLHSATRIEKRVLTRLRRRIYKNSRRLKIAQLLTRCKRRPEWMMISVLPVLPPDLRPILKMSEGAVVVSDLNNLYQRVVYRKNRFHRLAFIDFHFVTPIQRLVQDAVDRLIENGKGGSKPLSTPAGRPLKSLSDTLKGKKGRFRLNLLGKRVDFSGRSVIVVSPNLQIHECGIPRQIALELYNYFLIRLFVLKKQVSNVVMGKKMIKQKNAFVWDALRTLIYHHPVLLNRAPTLHRLGIQAFQPKLVQGNAICLNPLVCSGFNADFDGDQMGVHLPLSTQARAEAWDLLWSRNNLLSPATGQAVLLPSQDMVLGLYYMTQAFSARSVLPFKEQTLSIKDGVWESSSQVESEPVRDVAQKDAHLFKVVPRTLARANRVFFDSSQLFQAFQNKHILLHTPVWLQWKGRVENDEGFHAPIELRINSFASSTHVYSKYKRRRDESASQSVLYVRTTAGRVLINSILFS